MSQYWSLRKHFKRILKPYWESMKKRVVLVSKSKGQKIKYYGCYSVVVCFACSLVLEKYVITCKKNTLNIFPISSCHTVLMDILTN